MVPALIGMVVIVVSLWVYERFYAPSSLQGKWVLLMYSQGDVLYLSDLTVRRNSGDQTPIDRADAECVVEGPVKLLPIDQWPSTVPDTALFAVELTDEGVAFLQVSSPLYPTLLPLTFEFAVEDPPVEFLSSGWVKAAVPELTE